MSQQPLRVLLVDDETSLREPLSKHLRQTHAYQVDTAANGQETLDRLEQTGGRYDVALIDDLLIPAPGREPEPLGVALIKKIKSRYPNIEIIIFTGWGMESGLAALRAGAYRYLAKPLNLEELGMLIQAAAEHGRLKGIAREKQILEQLMQTSPTLLSGRNLPEVLDTILHGVQAIGFDRVGLYLLSDDRQMMVGQAQVGINPAFVGHERPVASDNQMQILLSDSRPHVFEREDDQPLPFEQELEREDVYQWACVPLILQGEVIGKLSMDNKFSRRPILESELGPVALFASQAAAAIENAGLYKEIAQERDHSEWLASQLLALHKITKEIQAELDLPRLLNLISRLAAELLGADAGGILLLDNEKKHLTFKGSYKLGQEIVEGTRDLVGGSIAGRVAETGKAIIANDIPNDSRFYNPAADGEGLLAVISTPLWIGGEIIGTLDVHSKTDPFAFDEDDLQILSLLATQAASAIQNAKLFQQTHQRALTLEALHETSLEITRYHQIPELVNSILNRAVELLQAKGGGVYLLDESGARVKLAALSDLPEHPVGMIVEVGDGVIGQVIKTKAPLAVSDYRNWPHRLRQYDTYGFTAVVSAPIIWQENIWGVIAVHDDIEGRNFDQQELTLLSHLGNLAAVALENAELASKDADKLRRLEQLAQTGSEIMGNLSTMPLDDRLNLIAQYAAEILEAEACGVFIVKRPGFLSLEASYGHREGGFTKGREFAIKKGSKTGLTGHIACESKLFNAYGDELTGHAAVKGEPNHAPSEQCYSLLVIPLLNKQDGQEKLIGLLRVDNKKDRNGQAGPTVGFTQEDEWILRLFADAAVTAIEGAELVVELSEQKDHLDRLITSSPNAVIAIDRDGNVTNFSEQAQKILNYEPPEVLGKPVTTLYSHPEEAHKVSKLLYEAPDGRLINHESTVRSKAGEQIPIRLAATQLVDTRGGRIGSIGYFEDLRVVREAEKRLDLLLKASNTVAQADSLTDGLQSLAELIVTFLDVSFCRSFLLDESQECLIAHAVFPIPTYIDWLDWDPTSEGIITIANWPEIAEALDQGGPTVLRIDYPEHQTFLIERSRQLGLKQDIQSFLLIPLRARDKVVGLLGLAELRPWEQAPFSQQKQELAMAIADQTGLLIDRIYLYEITDRHRQLLEALDEASRNIRAEKETFKLLQEVVRLAAELVDCTAGGLCINHPQLRELVLDVTFELPSTLIGSHLTHTEGLIGLVARTGQYQVMHNYSDWPDRENIFEAYHFKTVVGIPFKQAGEVEAVLFVADSTGAGRFAKADLDILERFAEQASIALQTSRLINREQRIFGQLAVLHKISDYIQTARDLDKILHVVLTGITAGYGLGFNRAVLFLLDEQQENLVGRMGIGHLNEIKARKDWERDKKHGVYDFGRYLGLLEQDLLVPTPVGERMRELRLPVQETEADVFSRVAREGQYSLVTQAELDELPDGFAETFEPALPLVVVPLVARDQVIGLLVADNKFTRSPITSEDIESLLTYANTAAVAIDKFQLLHETEVARARLRSFYQASNTLVSSRDPEQVLHDIVEQACTATHAYGASLVLIDQIGQVRHLVAASVNKAFDTNLMVRSDGLSMQIMRTGQPEIIEDTDKQRDRVNPSAFARGIGAAVGLPVSLEDKRIGVMWIDYNQPRHFSADEIGSMRLYVNQAAIAYDSARRIKTLSHLRQAAEALAGVAGLQEVLEQIIQSAKEVLLADSAFIWSYDPVRDRFILERSVVAGVPEETWKEFQRIGPRKGGTTYTVMERGWVSVTNIDDVQQYTFLGGSTHKLLEKIGAQSLQGIALAVGEEILGVLYVNYNYRRSFSAEEHQTAQSFANHAALALKKAKLLDQVGKARNAAHVVAEVTALENLDDTLQSVAEGTIAVTNCDAVTVYVYDQDKDRLSHSPTMVGVRYPDKTRRFSEVERDSVVFKMLARDQMYIVGDSSADPLFRDRRFTRDEQIAACVAIPLKVGIEKVGVMFVNYRRLHRFTNDELINIELFALQAAVAIRNVQLYEREQRRAKVLQALYKAGQAMAGSLEIGKILNHVAEQAWKLMGTYGKEPQFSLLALLEGTHLQFKVAYPARHLSGLKRGVGSIDLKQSDHIGIMGRAVKSGRTQLVGDVAKSPDYIEYDSGTLSELAVPIKVADEVIGVINVEHSHCDAFDEEDRQALELLAAQAAIAIQNARLYEEIQQRAEQFQTLYQASLNLTAEFSVEAVLQEVVDYARKLTGARYGALGVLDEGKIQPFITSGLKTALQKRIGVPPESHGVLGLLLREPKPIRVPDIRHHPDFTGFPPHHPKMISFLGVPIISKGSFIGNLYVANKQGASEFSQGDENVLELLATQAAIAIENARLFEQTQRRARLLDAAAEVARGATSILDEDQLLNETVRLVCDCFGFYHAGVFLLDEHREYAILRAASSEGGQQMLSQGHKLKVGEEGIVGYVTQTGEPRLTSDVSDDPHHFINPDLPHTRAEMAFPLIARGQVIGALDVQSTEEVNLQDEDIATLQTLADQLANAIQNAQLYQQVTRRLDEVNALLKTAVSLTGAAELDEVLGFIIYEARRLTGTQESSILFWDAQEEKFTQALRIKVGRTIEWYNSRARAKGGRARQIIDARRPIAISDAREVPNFNPKFLETGYLASLGVPLLSKGEPIGVLYVRDNAPHEFSDRQIALLEGLAGQATVAIERARHYEELKRTKGLVGARTAVAWMGMVSATWRHAIEGHAMTIEEEIGHLRTDSPPEHLDLIARRLDKIQRLARLILEKPITPPLSEEEGVESVTVNQLLQERLRQLWESEPYKPVQLRLDLNLADATTVRASPEWLRRVFDVLVDNAVEAMTDVPRSTLKVSTRLVGENLEIAFIDNGCGVAQDILPSLLHKQIEKPQGAKGLGMGLLMAQTIVQTYGGEIRVESTNGIGTMIVISLPIEAKM